MDTYLLFIYGIVDMGEGGFEVEDPLDMILLICCPMLLHDRQSCQDPGGMIRLRSK